LIESKTAKNDSAFIFEKVVNTLENDFAFSY